MTSSFSERNFQANSANKQPDKEIASESFQASVDSIHNDFIDPVMREDIKNRKQLYNDMKELSFPLHLLKDLDPELYESLKSKVGPDGMVHLDEASVPMHVLKELAKRGKLDIPEDFRQRIMDFQGEFQPKEV
jgi:hypothetical protein